MKTLLFLTVAILFWSAVPGRADSIDHYPLLETIPITDKKVIVIPISIADSILKLEIISDSLYSVNTDKMMELKLLSIELLIAKKLSK